MTAKLEVMENLKKSWKVMEFEELRRLWVTSLVSPPLPHRDLFGMMDLVSYIRPVHTRDRSALEVYVKTSGRRSTLERRFDRFLGLTAHRNNRKVVFVSKFKVSKLLFHLLFLSFCGDYILGSIPAG